METFFASDCQPSGFFLIDTTGMSGIEVDLFFTFWGLNIITKKKHNLSVATVGNPNMHPWFQIPSLVGVLPGMFAAAS